MPAPETERYILRITCRDDIGIVASVASFLAERRLFIVESADFGDPATGLFFIPISLTAIGRDTEARGLSQAVKLHIEGRRLLNGARNVVFA